MNQQLLAKTFVELADNLVADFGRGPRTAVVARPLPLPKANEANRMRPTHRRRWVTTPEDRVVPRGRFLLGPFPWSPRQYFPVPAS